MALVVQNMEVDRLKHELFVARNEISKIRQQVRDLQHVQRKNIESLKCLLRDFRCENCRPRTKEVLKQQDTATGADQPTANLCKKTTNHFSPIGVIRTLFAHKRGVPRQSSVGAHLRGVVEISSNVFSNPEHALEGLHEYSHIWLIYHFHKNSAHAKAKVAPPRLGGLRVGVFSTRSPHRPCPIGLSLVAIDRIIGSSIYFFGTDVVDGTPVLDIKPYIPIYDTPHLKSDNERSALELIGIEDSRLLSLPDITTQTVKVPKWVGLSHQFDVLFNERAERELLDLQVERNSIVDILMGDPRSVYLRRKYGSQIFTFQLGEFTVTCQFDDKATRVTVLQVGKTKYVQNAIEQSSNAAAPMT